MDRQAIVETFKPLVKNKYAITVFCFVMWLTFVDQDTLYVRYTLNKQVRQLEAERNGLREDIEQTRRKMDELKSDKAALEKFAREEYFMKKSDEVIFIVKD